MEKYPRLYWFFNSDRTKIITAKSEDIILEKFIKYYDDNHDVADDVIRWIGQLPMSVSGSGITLSKESYKEVHTIEGAVLFRMMYKLKM